MASDRIDDGAKCTYYQGGSDPHDHEARDPKPKIFPSVLDAIGNTPMVRLERLMAAEGIECELVAKCEYFNAGGSVKDRIGRRMVLDAEKSGRIKKGDVLIEPTSGNTGIGLALAAAIRGYRMIITLPEKMSQEKVDVLKALGAEIIRTPTEAAFDSPESHIGVANKLNAELENSHILDQYSNPSNPLAHYDTTAEEIYEQCGGKIDAIVMTAGTGGTITGIARKLKEKIPDVKVIGVDPKGSILALPEELNSEITSYQVEGIGYDFIPNVLDRNFVDEWLKSEDKSSFLMSRRLIREEGLLCGGSSGSAVVAALEVAKRYGKGQRVVVLLPDSVRNYMTKFLNVGWMVDNGFMEEEARQHEDKNPWLADHTVAELNLSPPVSVLPSVSCTECIGIFSSQGIDQLPVVSPEGNVVGVITLGNLQSRLTSGRLQPGDTIEKAVFKQFRRVAQDTPLDTLARIFDRDHFALCVTGQDVHGPESTVTTREIVVGVATHIDLLNFMVKNAPASE